MCGRFSQSMTREDYLQALLENQDIPTNVSFDAEPVGRYNVSPGTKVLIFSERDGLINLDPVLWGYAPEWWGKQPLINARSETAATGRMFSPLWKHGRAVVPADGWFEWKRSGDNKQPYFIYHKNKAPLFFAAIGKAPFDQPHEQEGFVIVTAASDQGLLDIHDRRPVVLTPAEAREWMQGSTSARRASDIVHNSATAPGDYRWHPVSPAVGNPRNQGETLLDEVNASRT